MATLLQQALFCVPKVDIVERFNCIKLLSDLITES